MINCVSIWCAFSASATSKARKRKLGRALMGGILALSEMAVGASPAEGGDVIPRGAVRDADESRIGAPRGQSAASLVGLSDEFDSEATLGSWLFFHERYGWPDKIKHLDVGKTTKGSLNIRPTDSAWVRDLYAPFMYKEVDGDFDVRARVRVRGESTRIAGGTWSLGGLMARVPSRNTSAKWVPYQENWHFITTGVGHVPGEQMLETKGTYNSYSSLKLRTVSDGWLELRLVRVGMSLVALSRNDGAQKWEVRDRWYRMEPNPKMEVGLVAYASSGVDAPRRIDPLQVNQTRNDASATNMQLEVDWIRFSRPRVTSPRDWYGAVSSRTLADSSLTDEDVLALLGE